MSDSKDQVLKKSLNDCNIDKVKQKFQRWKWVMTVTTLVTPEVNLVETWRPGYNVRLSPLYYPLHDSRFLWCKRKCQLFSVSHCRWVMSMCGANIKPIIPPRQQSLMRKLYMDVLKNIFAHIVITIQSILSYPQS